MTAMPVFYFSIFFIIGSAQVVPIWFSSDFPRSSLNVTTQSVDSKSLCMCGFYRFKLLQKFGKSHDRSGREWVRQVRCKNDHAHNAALSGSVAQFFY
jgi:hypothetical protein